MKDSGHLCKITLSAIGLLIWAGCCSANPAKDVVYYYSDQAGSVLAESDASGNIISRSDYRPYGQSVLDGTTRSIGFTGHVNDGDMALIYMQARYYDADTGRFLSKDPTAPAPGAIFGLNRFTYANNNPTTFRDPTGRDCRGDKYNYVCDPHTPGSEPYQIPTPPQFPPSINSNGPHHHVYDITKKGGPGSGGKAAAIATDMALDPTPGDDQPASVEGTVNDASPTSGNPIVVVGGELVKSPVVTYLRFDSHLRPVTINVTLPGHPLFPGYVVRYVEVTPSGETIIHNAGEGYGRLQDSSDVLGRFTSSTINSVWAAPSEAILNAHK